MNIELIHSTIKTIINQFRRKPDNFFNEHDFHQYCYHVFYRKKEFSKQYMTKDGRKTNVLHPEYPTLERFRRKPVGRVDSTGVRARYDMVILNPDFIEKNELETIRCRDIEKVKTDYETKNIFAALEFKFIVRHSLRYIGEIKFDYLKLVHAKEVNHKYILIFTNTLKRKIEYFEKLKLSSEIKAVYVAPNKVGRKKLEVKEYPPGWLYGGQDDGK